MGLCVDIYVGCNCGLRTTSKIIAYFNERFQLGLSSIPSFGSIKNWVEKCGYSVYQESHSQFYDKNYALITDESMMIGSEKMLLTLGVNSDKSESRALSFQDVSVLDISIESSWNAEKIAKVWADIESKNGCSPRYIISDNASILTKAAKQKQYIHIPDVSHTLAMYIERVYKNEASFINYTKALAQVKLKENMKSTSYLLPPKQRVVARFMNITPWIVWSNKLLSTYDCLSEIEKETFAFLKDHLEIIEELQEITQACSSIASLLKINGLSQQSADDCNRLIEAMSKSKFRRVIELSANFSQYLRKIVNELPEEFKNQITWHTSSDIVESFFGKYKFRKSPNPLNGVTRQVLLLPVLTRLDSIKKRININIKAALERNLLSDLTIWDKENLTDNMAVKRMKVLNAA